MWISVFVWLRKVVVNEMLNFIGVSVRFFFRIGLVVLKVWIFLWWWVYLLFVFSLVVIFVNRLCLMVWW